MWDLPWPGIKPASPTLTGKFLTTGPPGKPSLSVLISLSMGTSIPLSIHLSTFLSSVHLLILPFFYPYIYMPSLHLSIWSPIYLSIHVSVYPLHLYLFYSSIVDLQYYITFIFKDLSILKKNLSMFPALAGRLLTTGPPGKPPPLLKKSNRLHFLEQFCVYRKTDWKVQRVPRYSLPSCCFFCYLYLVLVWYTGHNWQTNTVHYY